MLESSDKEKLELPLNRPSGLVEVAIMVKENRKSNKNIVGRVLKTPFEFVELAGLKAVFGVTSYATISQVAKPLQN